MTTFDDPGLRYGAALSKVVGRLVLRVADADTPPQRFGDFADTVAIYLDEVKKLAEEQRAQDMTREKLLKDGAFRLASDPLKPVGQAIDKPMTPHIELAALADAVDRLGKSAKAYDAIYKARGAALPKTTREQLNSLLRDIDQLLLDPRGLPGRPWYQHMIYAPGRFTGYGAKTLPGVREAIEERRFDDANLYAGRIAAVLDAYSKRLEEALALIDGK
jgi:N-acetylated-alpha-linked acidic dipeptidase